MRILPPMFPRASLACPSVYRMSQTPKRRRDHPCFYLHKCAGSIILWMIVKYHQKLYYAAVCCLMCLEATLDSSGP